MIRDQKKEDFQLEIYQAEQAVRETLLMDQIPTLSKDEQYKID